jgi:hypothetical protein
MEQQIRSNTTNSTNHQATHKTSSIKPAHLWGLLDLNPGQPSHSLSPFSTASVADSVESAEYTETNPKGIDAMEQEAPPIDQDAPGDPNMNDTESDSDKEETPAVVMEKEAPAREQQAHVDNGMPDSADESQIDEISTGGNFALFMTQVCLF